MEHTFLFEQGEWTANGNYSDEKNRRLPATGTSKITHAENHWIHQSSLTMFSLTGLVAVENRYVVKPFDEGKECTRFRAENPGLGRLSGSIVVVGDSVLAVSSSDDGSIAAVEYFRRLSDTLYENRGFLLKRDEKVSSWDLELHREG